MITGYGFWLALGMTAGAIVAIRLSPRAGVTREAMAETTFWALLAGFIGARLLHVAVEWRFYLDLCVAPDLALPNGVSCLLGCVPGQECDGHICRNVGDCLNAFKFWQGGLTFLGGVVAGIPAALVAARRQKASPEAAFTLLMLALPLGHMFGRIGCWFEGCCHGRHSQLWLAVDGKVPTQLIEAGFNGLVFLVLLARFLELTRKGMPAPSRLLGVPALYMMLYGPFRFLIEPLRGDPQRGFLFELPWPWLARTVGFSTLEPAFLSTSQILGIVLLILGFFLWRLGLTSPRTPRAAPGETRDAR
ncbi:MAG: prolipoprotein diacylglyceryl transferase [Deltaproteobacteria bacterium]|nr:prolipoprotein diacylglyceryl transferase [Deltaproteobacteria bacterium]